MVKLLRFLVVIVSQLLVGCADETSMLIPQHNMDFAHDLLPTYYDGTQLLIRVRLPDRNVSIADGAPRRHLRSQYTGPPKNETSFALVLGPWSAQQTEGLPLV